MKPQIAESMNFKNLQKNPNLSSFEKLKNTSSKIKLSSQISPHKFTINNQSKIGKDNLKFNKKENIDTKLNINTKSNININSDLHKPKIKKNKTHTKYNHITSNNDNNMENITHFQT